MNMAMMPACDAGYQTLPALGRQVTGVCLFAAGFLDSDEVQPQSIHGIPPTELKLLWDVNCVQAAVCLC